MNLFEPLVLDNVFKLFPGVEFLKPAEDGPPLWYMRLLCVLLNASFEGSPNLSDLDAIKVSKGVVKVLFGGSVEKPCRESAGVITLIALQVPLLKRLLLGLLPK